MQGDRHFAVRVMANLVEGEVQLTEVAYRRRRQLLCRITDGTGSLTLRFFYFSGAQQAGLARGTRIRCFGEVRRGPLGLEIVHPEYRRIGQVAAPLEEVLTPIYPTTEGVPQPRLRSLIELEIVHRTEDGLRWKTSTRPEDVAIPDTLNGLLVARIDRLDDETRATLQLASVIGRTFDVRILKAVSESGGREAVAPSREEPSGEHATASAAAMPIAAPASQPRTRRSTMAGEPYRIRSQRLQPHGAWRCGEPDRRPCR